MKFKGQCPCWLEILHECDYDHCLANCSCRQMQSTRAENAYAETSDLVKTLEEVLQSVTLVFCLACREPVSHFQQYFYQYVDLCSEKQWTSQSQYLSLLSWCIKVSPQILLSLIFLWALKSSEPKILLTIVMRPLRGWISTLTRNVTYHPKQGCKRFASSLALGSTSTRKVQLWEWYCNTTFDVTRLNGFNILSGPALSQNKGRLKIWMLHILKSHLRLSARHFWQSLSSRFKSQRRQAKSTEVGKAKC